MRWLPLVLLLGCAHTERAFHVDAAIKAMDIARSHLETAGKASDAALIRQVMEKVENDESK